MPVEPSLPNSSLLTVHRLRVTLLDVTPPVWRTFVVPSALPLSTLHLVVQIIMGWTNSHLHEWEVGGIIYASPEEEDWGEEVADESAVLLSEVAPEDSSLLYRYDFGDGWEHLVAVDAVEPFEARTAPLACTGGARACPPEDCGGPSGYEHLLDALADPADPEHEELTLLYGDEIDPEAFDLTGVNAALEEFVRDATG